MTDAQFIGELDRATDGCLGKIRRVGQRGAFPLTARDAMSYAGERTALIGDAAHVVHPLAGLGANIGFMDVATLAQLLLRPSRSGLVEIGGERMLRRYERKRRGENRLLMTAMSAFNTVFSNDDALLGVMRDGGLKLADQIAPAKNFLMRRAMWMDFGLSGLGGAAATPHPRESGQESRREQ
jgi:2-octaprenylphenol hydroxylase